MSELSIIFPIYNSRKFIADSVKRIIDECLLRRLNVEILLCDDASDDQSCVELEKLDQEHEGVRIFRNERNHGIGYTLRRLVSLASSKKIIYCDIDLPFGEGAVFDVWKELDDADVVVASRYFGEKNHVSFGRKFFSRIYWILCWLFFNIQVKDIGSGTVGFLKSKIQALNLESDGFDIHLELYVRAARQHFRIKEIGLPSSGKNAKVFSILRHTFPILKQTFRLWWKLLLNSQKNKD